MPQPLDYHPEGPPKTPRPGTWGLIRLCVGCVMLTSPGWLGRGMVTACIAGLGFLCACVGLNMIFHAAWDRRREK